MTRLPSLSVASTWFSIEHGIVSVASSTRVLHLVVCAVRIIVGTIFGTGGGKEMEDSEEWIEMVHCDLHLRISS